MAWVKVGPHKINTEMICYVEQDGDALRIFFQGRWQGNPLELHFDEAKALWRYLKADDLMGPKEKGSTMVLPRAHSPKMMEIPSPLGGDSAPSAPASSAASPPANGMPRPQSGAMVSAQTSPTRLAESKKH